MGLHDFPYGKAMLKKPFLMLVVVAALSMTGCPDGGDGTSSGGSLASSGNLVYLADQSTNGVFELFLASTGTKLNGPIVAGGNGVTSFALTPDKSAVVYIADEKTVGVFELFRVNIATPGQSVKLNGTLTPGGDVTSFAVTPDGTSVVYRANQRNAALFEVFQVLFATPQASTPLNPSFPVGSGGVTKFAVTPDSTKVVYIADQNTPNVNELYQVAFINPLNAPKLNVPLAAPKNVTDFAISSNSASVVYLADQNINGVFEIFPAPISGPGSATSLNSPLSAGQTITAFAITPDNSSVIYRANNTPAAQFALFLVTFAQPQTSVVTLNGALTPGGNVSSFTIAPNGSSVVYSADQNIVGVVEVFRVPITPVGAAQKINPTFAAPQTVSAFAITPDSSAAVYLANQRGTNSGATTNAAGYAVGTTVITLALAGTGTIMAGDVITFTGDSNNYVVVSGDNNVADGGTITLATPGLLQAIPAVATTITTVNNVAQLYRVPFSCLQVNPAAACPQAIPAPTNLPPLNGALVAGGAVCSFAVSPDSTLVFYLADQTTFAVTELYAVNVGSPGASSKLNGQLTPGGNVTAFAF